MSTFVWGMGLSYADYLRSKKQKGAVTAEVPAGIRPLIVSNPQLELLGITLRETAKNAGGMPIEVLQYKIDPGIQKIREIDSTYRWEYAQLLAMAGRMGDPPEELAGASNNPGRTRAYEQYRKAREEYRRHNGATALAAIELAIDGFGGSMGYWVDFRFHYFLGVIRLGNVDDTEEGVLDLAEASRSLLEAAKYARTNHPSEAARAYLAAGHASYCQGQMSDAQQWTTEAIALNNGLAEAHFQQGKFSAHAGDGPGALRHLRNAMLLDPPYALRALDDGDYEKLGDKVTAFLTDLHERAKDAVQSNLEDAKRQYSQLKAAKFGERDFETCLGRKYRLGDALTKASDAFRQGSYPDYLECARWLRDVIPKLGSARQEFLQVLEDSILKKPDGGESELAQARESDLPDALKEVRRWGSVVLVVLGIAIKNGGESFIVLGLPALWIGVSMGHGATKAARYRGVRDKLEARIAHWQRLNRDYPAFRAGLISATPPLSAMAADKIASSLLK